MKKFLFLLIVNACSLGLHSCSKGVSGPVNLFGGGVDNIPNVNYKINFHRVNTYPARCKILVDEYFSNDSVSFLRLAGGINIDMPASDSTFTSTAFSNNFYYLSWKVIGPNNDSLAGGKTAALKMKEQATFGINY